MLHTAAQVQRDVTLKVRGNLLFHIQSNISLDQVQEQMCPCCRPLLISR